MSTTLASEVATAELKIVPESTPVHKEPLKLTGMLEQFKSFEVTPVIGREYPEASLKEWLESPNADALLRDLAITSTFILHIIPEANVDSLQFPAEVSSFSGNKTT